MEKKKTRNLNPYILLFGVIAACAVLSHFIAPGAFERTVVNGKTVVVPDSFHAVEGSAGTLLDVFRAIPQGFMKAGPVVAIILAIGGMLRIYDRTEVIPLGIYKLISKLGQKSATLIVIAFYLIFAILGGFLGWIETMLPFTPIVVAIMLALGLDSMVAVAVTIIGMMAGFCAGPTNMLTVGIAQSLSELPTFSGLELRLAVWAIFLVLSLAYILRYCAKIRKNPSASLVADVDTSSLQYDFSQMEGKKMNMGQKLSLLALLVTFIVVLYGMFNFGWNINDMTAAFLLCGVIAGLVNRMKGGEIVTELIEGSKTSMGGAMIVAVASGVQWILEKTSIVDPIIYFLSNLLSNASPFAAAIGIVLVVSLLNGLVPSGSGKAVALLPLIIPLGDLVGLNRQITTLCYQFGDGLTNMIWFTYGSLLMFLSYGKIPYKKWMRFFAPLLIAFYIVAFVTLFIAIQIGYGPF